MKGKTSSPPSGKAPMSDADFRALPILTWVPDPNNPGFSLYRSDRKFYYASSIPDDKLAAAPALLHAHEGIGVPGKEPIAFLARPEDPELRAKWVVCVFRLPDSHQEPLRTEEQSYFAGMVDGILVAGMELPIE